MVEHFGYPDSEKECSEIVRVDFLDSFFFRTVDCIAIAIRQINQVLMTSLKIKSKVFNFKEVGEVQEGLLFCQKIVKTLQGLTKMLTKIWQN